MYTRKVHIYSSLVLLGIPGGGQRTRLQKQLQGYHCEYIYCPGSQYSNADAYSGYSSLV